MKPSEIRAKAAKNKEEKAWERKIRAKALKENGYSDAAIAKALGVSEGTVRNLLKEEKE